MRSSFEDNKEPLLEKNMTELDEFSNSDVDKLTPSTELQSFLDKEALTVTELIESKISIEDLNQLNFSFLDNTGLTITDLIKAKISIETLNQLLNLPLSRRILRWLVLDDTFLKGLLWPFLDERGINLDSIAHGRYHKSCCSIRIRPGAAAMPFQSEKMLKRVYGITGFFQGAEVWIGKVWSLILLSSQIHDIYFYYAYPDERYDTTLWSIFFLTQGENTKSFVASFTQPTIWPIIFLPPVFLGLYNAIYGFCSSKELDANEIVNLQDTLKKYKQGWRDHIFWILPCNTVMNAVATISQALLWDNRLSAEDRTNLFNALQYFVSRSRYLSQLEGLSALAALAYGVASKDFKRLHDLHISSDNIINILMVKTNALEKLRDLEGKDYSWRSLQSIMLSMYVKYRIWSLGQSRSKMLPWNFLIFTGYKLYNRIAFFILIIEGIILMWQRYIQQMRCEEQGKLWMYMDRVADYVCSMCGDLNVYYRNIFTIQDCLQDFLSRPQEVTQAEILFNRIIPQDNITIIDLSLQKMSDEQRLLKTLLPILIRRLPYLQKLDLSGEINKMGPESMQALSQFLPKMTSLTELNLNSQNLEDNEILAILPNTTVKYLHLQDNNIGFTGISLLAQGLKNSSIVQMDLLLNQVSEGLSALAAVLPGSRVEELRLDFNDIDDKGAEELSKGLRDSKLRILDLGYNNIGANGMLTLASQLPYSNLEELYLVAIPIGDKGVQALAAAIPNSQLRSLVLIGNGLSANGTLALAKSLTNSNIQIFFLGDAEFDINSAQALATALLHSEVRELYLEGNNINDDVFALAKGLAKIERLHLANNQISSIGIKELARFLPTSNIQVLDVSENLIDDDGAAALASALTQSNVEELHLQKNIIGNKGAAAIGSALAFSNLHYLDLGYNLIGADGATGLALGLPNSNLLTLYLYHNNIGNKGVEAFATGLLNAKLQFLYLINTTITAEGVEVLAKVLANPTLNLLTLDLSTNPIGDNGVEAIASQLSKSKLQGLSLRSNLITDVGTSILASELPRSQLTSLQLFDNKIGDVGAEAIAQVLITSVSSRALLVNSINPNLKRVLAQADPNTHLVSLNLQKNQINSSGAVAICRIAPQTKIPIQNLYLSENPGIDPNVVDIQTCTISAAASLSIPWPYSMMGQAYRYATQALPSGSGQVNPSSASFQNPTTSINEKLIAANWVLHYGRKLINFIAESSPFTLPWNRAKPLSKETEKQLQLQQKNLGNFEAIIIAQKQSRTGSNLSLQDKFHYLDTQASVIKKMLVDALQTKKISQSDQEYIETQLERMEKTIHELAIANKQLKHANVKIRREVSRAKFKNESIVVVTNYTAVDNSCSQQVLKLDTQNGQSRFSALQQFWIRNNVSKGISKIIPTNHSTEATSNHFIEPRLLQRC